MRSRVKLTYVVVVLIPSSTLAENREDGKELPDVIATSGDVGDVEIRTVRIKQSDAAVADWSPFPLIDSPQPPDGSYIKLKLWAAPQFTSIPDQYSIRITALDPVFDDTGNRLPTKEHNSMTQAIEKGIYSTSTRQVNRRDGPLLDLYLEAPNRQAQRLIDLKGILDVTAVENATVVFQRLPKIANAHLRHERLEGLRIVPEITTREHETTMQLKVSGQLDDFVDFAVTVDGEPFKPISVDQRDLDFFGWTTRTWRAVYPGKMSDTWALSIIVRRPKETKRLHFDFHNLELP